MKLFEVGGRSPADPIFVSRAPAQAEPLGRVRQSPTRPSRSRGFRHDPGRVRITRSDTDSGSRASLFEPTKHERSIVMVISDISFIYVTLPVMRNHCGVKVALKDPKKLVRMRLYSPSLAVAEGHFWLLEDIWRRLSLPGDRATASIPSREIDSITDKYR